MNSFIEYYNSQFQRSSDTGSIYGSFTALIEAAHLRRIHLLDQLPIGDTSKMTIVDFGTGSWGFACIYPRLQHCDTAIGFDISAEAVRQSQLVSLGGDFPYRQVSYKVSSGHQIPLESKSVDILFAGECIEHIENTDAFLDEAHRVLKPSGRLILTTPNADACVYKSLGQKYAHGPEHIALMTYTEILAHFERRFQVVNSKGFNASFHRDLDESITDAKACASWASYYQDLPQYATGMIFLLQPTDTYQPQRHTRREHLPEKDDLVFQGKWTEALLHETLVGRMGKDGSSISFTVAAPTLILLFWAHDWSGGVAVEYDGKTLTHDLYESVGGFRRIVIRTDDYTDIGRVNIKAIGRLNHRSQGDQVIFFSAASYTTH